jgi:uncharacterized protein (TIGR02300 family)
MAMTAAQIHSARGAKHTCGNDECGKRFYDLNRSPLDCPYCGVTLDLEVVMPRHQFVMEAGKSSRSKYYKLAAPAPEAEEAPAQEADTDSDNDNDSDDATADADTPNILIEDDESDPTTDDVIEKPHSDDEAS